MPPVRTRDAERAPGLALVAGVADVVVGLVDLARPLERVGRRTVVGSEAADVHLPGVERRLTGHDPLGHDLADRARAGQSVGAEAGGDEEAGHLRLSEAELVVGSERLRSVDESRDRDLVHHGHAPLGVLGDLLEALPVLLEQAAVEIRRDAVASVGVEEPRRAAAFVAPHHESPALLPEVDEVVGIAQGGQVGTAAVAERLGHEILVGEGHDGYAHTGHPPDLRRVHAAGVDHDLGLDVAPLGAHATHAPAVHLDTRHPAVGEHAPAAPARAVGQSVGELRGVEVAVGGEVGGGAHAVGDHEREELARLLGGDPLQRQPERARPRHLAVELLLAFLGAGEPDPSALDPPRVGLRLAAEPAVELDAVHHHPGQRERPPELADEPGRVERRTARQLAAIEQDHVAFAELGQVVGDRGPADPAADDDHAGTSGQLTRTRHRATLPVEGRRPR